MRIAAALLLVLALLAGCGQPSGPVRHDLQPVDGAAALEFVQEFALRDDGSPRYRIPGTVGQQEGAARLWQATDLPGWTRSWDNFTGADYQQLDRSRVAYYTQVGNSGCTAQDSANVTGLPFANLLVTRGPILHDVPLVLLGAHWDSQMRSDVDPDPAKRDLPDPGANDGASGVGLLLQLMRELDAQAPDLPFTLGILFIDGEDGFFDCYPLAGSLHFAQRSLPAPTSAFILLDMVGDPGAKYPKETNSRNSAPELVELLWSHGQALDGGEHFLNTSRSISDDHIAFIQQGVPAVDIIDAGRPGTTFPPQWDTSFDTVDLLDAEMLGLVGDTLLRTLTDPAFADLLGPMQG